MFGLKWMGELGCRLEDIKEGGRAIPPGTGGVDCGPCRADELSLRRSVSAFRPMWGVRSYDDAQR